MPARTAFVLGQTYPLRRGRGHTATITAIRYDEGHARLWGVVTGPSYDEPIAMSWQTSGKTGLGYAHGNDLVAPLPAHLAGLQSLFNEMSA